MDAVDQLLFGYRDGHGLIAASCRPDPTQLRDVMRHVDGFVERPDERQLVGTWVPSCGAYLLAAIWAAPERPRPGAVWAHVLLISAAALDRGRVPSLLGLLRRPVDGSFDGYRRRLPWPSGYELTAAPPRLARALAAAVRADDEHLRIVLWPYPAQAEGALMMLLDTAPAGRRRRAVSFRTGQRVPNAGRPYRVQVAAALSGRASANGAVIVDLREPAAAASEL